ncbi:glycosyltransferase family 4 protein [Flavobacterium sp. KACC 22763]|uniref:glycosyltransferase family 4 protein n=1 Tax=Flavobacterium sp. KACC 22763 TaxID=3025668 RepID=UPI002365A6D7|nr:glycosyltransferase family 4 protein [Flavobacterium sp. KACC 22763]WDF62870.1 glycosyltransferase family 4 protein [Flavobacterium sp. KACC 22763]
MNDSIKVILISQIPLPYSKIGSWSTLYNNYLENDHKIDYIVCPETNKKYNSIQYHFVKETFLDRLLQRVFKRKNQQYLRALDRIIQPNEKYIIQIIDNYGMVKPVYDYLISKKVLINCYIHFFYHGFSPYIKTSSGINFYDVIDELIVLTYESYREHKKIINVLPCRFSVLHNGIDTTKFKKASVLEREDLRKKFDVDNKKVFVWCSQDRPKKGLHIILEAWANIYNSHKNIVLLVIGCERRDEIEGVKFLGKMPNDELSKYLKASDCYLFSTLCQEGFGLSLIEALHCGNYCIASAMGGVPEVLQYGKLGKLIENPHFVSEWIDAINDYLENKFEISEINEDLYSITSWRNGMNQIIEKAKKRLEMHINK